MKTFDSEKAALNLMRCKNQSTRCAPVAKRDLFAVVDGPGDGEFSVVDMNTAIELGGGYTWEA